MTTPSRTGTASQVDASGGNGSTSVTVPADATAVVAFWAHWDNDGGSTLSALTLGGAGFSIRAQVSEDGGIVGTGVATLESPSTGSQTCAWTWSAGGARAEGGWIVLVYVKDANIGDVYRAADVDQQAATNNVEVTIASALTDLVLAAAQSFNADTPAISGTVFINNAALNSELYDLSEVTAGASTTTVTMTGENYSSMAVISLKESAAAGGLDIPIAYHHYRTMHS
jgi:hypothetical protein